MLWLGDRTRQVDGAHAAYLSGIENVVGVKCGPTLDPDELVRLADRLDPDRRVGKLLLIGRFGAALIDQLLPPLLDACRREGILAAWMIDPMHGNSRREGARKVRRLPDIMAETERFFAICADRGVWPTGIHLEMSALDVTECLGGRGPALIEDLDLNWQSACDPRLNRAQAIDLATDVARLLGAARPALASTA